MCDCYDEPCKVCGKLIPFHLGDYDTPRLEIAVICGKCQIPDRSFMEKNYCVWEDDGLGNIKVFSLTKRAWENHEMNCPNTGKCDLVGEFKSGKPKPMQISTTHICKIVKPKRLKRMLRPEN